MALSVLILKNPIPVLAVTFTIIIFTAFMCSEFLSALFTISILILSSIFFNLSKHKAALETAPLQEADEYLPQNKMESFSESESIGHSSITDHDSEIDWPCSINRIFSDDGSISDEESLIEIALTSGHFVSTESFSGWKDFSAEINYEEDNLIEIDLSIGSIKCSRFEIKA